MMLIGSGILLKNMLVVIYSKILHDSFIQTICKNLKSDFLPISCKRKFGNLHAWSMWAFERTKAVLMYFYWTIFHKWALSQKRKIYSLKTSTCSHITFIWVPSVIKQLLEKFFLDFLHAFNISCTWNIEASSCR